MKTQLQKNIQDPTQVADHLKESFPDWDIKHLKMNFIKIKNGTQTHRVKIGEESLTVQSGFNFNNSIYSDIAWISLGVYLLIRLLTLFFDMGPTDGPVALIKIILLVVVIGLIAFAYINAYFLDKKFKNSLEEDHNSIVAVVN